MSIKQDIINESLKKDEEVCGFIVNDNGIVKIYPIENKSTDKEVYFVIPAKEYLYVEKKFEILGVYHSHIFGNSEPSEMDKKMSEATCYPFVIYSKEDKNFNIYCPALSDIKKEDLEKIL